MTHLTGMIFAAGQGRGAPSCDRRVCAPGDAAGDTICSLGNPAFGGPPRHTRRALRRLPDGHPIAEAATRLPGAPMWAIKWVILCANWYQLNKLYSRVRSGH